MKRIASKLPMRWQQELKRLYFSNQIKRGRFITFEEEFNQLDRWLREGDWILDIGANIGQYTVRFSEKVGKEGRVIAMEPVPETFEILAANVALLPIRNVTLLNLAASDSFASLGFTVPAFETGLKNYYQAHHTDENPEFTVLSLPIDSLDIPHRIRLAKIDTEGHDFSVLKGMKKLLQRDRPILIVEDGSQQVVSFLKEYGYSFEKNQNSPNLIFENSDVVENR